MCRILRDPIYDYVTCSKEEMRIIDSPWFQRLRGCSQNGVSRFVYPTLIGTRFEHSLGVMHLAGRIARSILDTSDSTKDTKEGASNNSNIVTDFLKACMEDFEVYLGEKPENNAESKKKVIQYVRLAALCHDIGHMPLSHTLESVFKKQFCRDIDDSDSPPDRWYALPQIYEPGRACHEILSAEIVRQISLLEDVIIDPKDAHAIILLLLCPQLQKEGTSTESDFAKHSVFSTLHRIIVSAYDADRLDYLQRDSFYGFGSCPLIDIERLINSLQLYKTKSGNFVILPSTNAVSAIEGVLLARYRQKKWIQQHHKTVFFECLAQEMGQKVLSNSPDDALFLFEMYSDSRAEKYREKLRQLRTQKVSEDEFQGKFSEEISGDYYQEIFRSIWKSDFTQKNNSIPLMLHIDPSQDRFLFRKINIYALIGRKSKTELSEKGQVFDDHWFWSCARTNSNTKKDAVAIFHRQLHGKSFWKTAAQFNMFWGKLIKSLKQKMENENLQTQIQEKLADEKLLEDLQKYSSSIREYLSKTFEIPFFIHWISWEALFFEVSIPPQAETSEESNEDNEADEKLREDYPDEYLADPKVRPVKLVSQSHLIKSLAGLKGETPFYLFAQTEKNKAVPSDDDLIEKMAEFILEKLKEKT